MTHFRLTRLEIFLLLAFALASAAQVAVGITGPRDKDRGHANWEQQEREVQKEIRETFSGGREEMEARVRREPGLWLQFQMGFFFLLFLAAGALIQFLRMTWLVLNGRPFAPALGGPPVAGWGLREILRVVLAAMVVSELALIAQWGVLRVFHPAWLDRSVTALANTLVMDLTALAGAGWLLARRSGARPEGKAGAREAVRFAAGAYLMFLPVLVMALLGVARVLDAFHLEPAPQPIFTLYLAENRAPILGWLLVLVTLVGPAAEEIFFRGLVHGWLRGRVGAWVSIGLTAFVFALMHNDIVAFLPIFLLGLIFGWVYEKTGSLAAPVAIHVLHNGGMLYFASLMKSLMVISGRPG